MQVVSTLHDHLNALVQAGDKAGLCTAAGVSHSTCSGLSQDTSPDAQHQASAGEANEQSNSGDVFARYRQHLTQIGCHAVLGASEFVGVESDTLPARSSRAFLDALRPRSPTEQCSPGVAAHAQRPTSGRALFTNRQTCKALDFLAVLCL